MSSISVTKNSVTIKDLVVKDDETVKIMNDIEEKKREEYIVKSINIGANVLRNRMTAVDINYVEGVFDVDGGSRVELYNAVQDGNASAQGTKVGEAKVRQLVYSSGTPGAQAAVYRLYLYDVQMLSGDFKSVKGSPSSNKSWLLITFSFVTLLPRILILSTKIFSPSYILNLTIIDSPSIISSTLCSTNCKFFFSINSSISSNNNLILKGE